MGFTVRTAGNVLVLPALYFYAPYLAPFTEAIINGDPSKILTFAETTEGHAQALQQQAHQVANHAQATTSFWEGITSERFNNSAASVSRGLKDLGGSVSQYADTAQRLAEDFERLIKVVTTGQQMADKTVASLAKIPYVGHALAAAYGAKTYAWTAIGGFALLRTGQDVVAMVTQLQGDHVKKSWTPPTANPMPTIATAVHEQRHDGTPFGGSTGITGAVAAAAPTPRTA